METIRETEVRQQAAPTAAGIVQKQTVSSEERVSGAILAKRIIYYIGGVIMVLLAVRFVLLLLGASRASGFVNFIYSLSGFFVAPFSGIFKRPVYGTSAFDSATLVAMIVYAILTVGVAKLLTLNKADRDVE